jgi:linoleoyl-CoA desaturase
MHKPIRFARTQAEFFPILTQRVNAYFVNNNIKKTANAEMVIKTIFMIALYFTPYALLLAGVCSNVWQMWGLYAVMGLGKAGIGLSIMHDANHGSYSDKKWVNKLMGATLNMVGGHAFNWIVQHNVLHHTYTNVHDVDEDISPRGVLRMAPESEWKPFHKWQHLYAWFFYCLLTVVWILFKDYNRLMRYHKDGLVASQKTNIVKEWVVLIATKIIYLSYIIVLPLMLLQFGLGQLFVGFMIMHFIAGFILAIIFQPAHVIEGTEYPMPDETGTLENNWAIHQLHTTTNFGHRHKIFSWYVGGLNYQVEHHLFPNICHVHYRHIAKIVEETTKEFGLPYKTKDTFVEALIAHKRLLKELGVKPEHQIVEAALVA